MKKCKIMISSLLLMSMAMPMMSVSADPPQVPQQALRVELVNGQNFNDNANMNFNMLANRGRLRGWNFERIRKIYAMCQGIYGFIGNFEPDLNKIVAAYLKKFAVNIYHKFISGEPIEEDEMAYMERVMEKLEKDLNELVVGQKEQKNKIIETIGGILNERFIEGKSQAKLLYLAGPSGVGKTYVAEVISKALNKDGETHIIDPVSVIPSNQGNGKKRITPADVFGMKSDRFFLYLDDDKRHKSIVDYVEETKHPVIMIEEYDKMWSKDLENLLRAIVDQGKVNIDGEVIDFSKAIFIITSNEDHCSLFNCNSDEPDNDKTGSRTKIKHDKTVMNRFELIEFDNLSNEDYKQLAERLFNGVAESYKNKYNITVNIDGMIDGAADKAEQINRGARPIINNIKTRLIYAIDKARRECKGVNSFKASYDAQKGEINITGVDGKEGENSCENSFSVKFYEDSASSTEPDGDEEEIVDLNNIDFPMVLNYVLQ